jgi:hypothetical protein
MGLGSLRSTSEGTDQTQREAGPSNVSEQIVSGPSSSSVSNLEQMLMGFMSAMQQSNRDLQDSIRADLSATNAKLEQFQNSIRKDIKTEIEKLSKKFELKNQEIKKEFTAKLDSEARRLTNLVGQVQREVESELLAAKGGIEGQKSEMNTAMNKLEQVVDNKIMRQKETIDQIISREQSVVEDKFQQVNAKIVALESKVQELPRQAVLTDSRAVNVNDGSPSAVNRSDQVKVGSVASSVQADGNRTCSCQANTCDVCVPKIVHERSMNGPNDYPPVSSLLSTTELPLPVFDDCAETNPVYHLRQLDEFMKLKGIPREFKLTVAYRSIVGHISKQWVETVSRDIQDYDEFKQAFLKTFWSTTQQSLVRCNLYQGKYNRSANLSLSGYFLKYATMASYLDPTPSVVEVVEAVRSHYPIGIQRAMLSGQVRTIGEALDLLKRIELIEMNAGFQNPNTSMRNQNPSSNDRRAQTQNHVRQIQYSRQERRNNGNRRHNQNQNYNDRARDRSNAGSTSLNPRAPAFLVGQEQVQQPEN